MDWSDVDFFIAEAKRTPLLSREEEVQLARLIRKGGTEGAQAKDRFIRANLRLVISIANSFARRNPKLALQDLIQEGSIGLMRAVDKFDPDRGFKFSTYAGWWIKQACTRATMQADEIRVPVYKMEVLYRVSRADHMLSHDLGRTPTDEEIADWVGCTIEVVAELRSIPKADYSLDDFVTSGSEVSYADILEDENAPNAENDATVTDFDDRLDDLMQELSPRDRHLVHLRFAEDQSLDQIGKEVGLTRERVRQIINKALGVLRLRMMSRRIE